MLPNSNQPAFIVSNQEDESSFDFWGVLSRRKWLVFLGLVTGMALGGLYHAQCETVYESVAKVKIEPKNPMMVRFSSGENGMPTTEFSTRHDRLMGEYNIVNNCLKELKDLPSFDDIPEAEVVQHVMNNLRITPDKEERVLYELVYWSSRKDDGQTVLNNLISTYEEMLDAQYRSNTQEYTQLLKQVDEQFNNKYASLQEKLELTLAKHKVASVNSEYNPHQIAMRDLSRSLQGSKESMLEWSADSQRINEAFVTGPESVESLVWILHNENKIKDPGARPHIEQDNTGPAEQQIKALQLDRQTLLNRLGPSHPDVKEIDGRIAFWTEQLAGTDTEAVVSNLGLEPSVVLGRYRESLNERIENEQLKIENNLVEYNRHNTEFGRLQMVERKIDDIRRQRAEVANLISAAQKKIVEIDPGGNLDSNRHEGFIFETLRSATLGEEVWPILPVILGIGGLLGLLAGFGLGCLVELADKTFHNPDEIMKQLNVPLIGHVPVIGQSKRYLVENSLIEPIVCTYHRPRSQVSEAFRAVRTALYFNTQGKQNSVIQVTSPTPGDGKSTLASNLAVSIAQSGKRVLLVDGDMRRPRQAATFGISAEQGFATVLSGQTQWRESIFECEEIEGLSVMPCGAKPNNPAELSSSPQVKELIEEMRAEFDFVVIDTPPLLAVTDACPIAARVDGVILCIRIKKNVRVSAERATEMLGNLGANCIGLVVNGVGAQSGYGSQYTYGAYRAGYSYNGYGYGYGYGHGGKYYDDEKKPAQPTPNAPKHLESQQREQHPPVA